MPDMQELNAPVLSVEQKVGTCTQTTQEGKKPDSNIKKTVLGNYSFHHIGLPATADKGVSSEVTSENGGWTGR